VFICEHREIRVITIISPFTKKKNDNRVKHKLHKTTQITKRIKHTIGSGAFACWHITQGTPVSRDVAIDAAQFM
jgi:hypothetical protein